MLIIDYISIFCILIMSLIGYKRSIVGMLLYIFYIFSWTFGYVYILELLNINSNININIPVIRFLYNILVFIVWIFITTIFDPILIFITKRIPLSRFLGLLCGLVLGIILCSINYQLHVLYYQMDKSNFIMPQKTTLIQIEKSYTHKIFFRVNQEIIIYFLQDKKHF